MAPGILQPSKYAANAAMKQASTSALDLGEPLIPKTAPPRDDEKGSAADGQPKMTMKGMASTVAVSLLATGGLAAALSAMVAVPSALVLVMGGLCLFNAPSIAHKQLSIAKSDGVRASVGLIRKEAEVLKTEVDFLQDSVMDLQAEADVLDGIEQELRGIAAEQEINVMQLVDLVKENEVILEQMKGNLRQAFVTSMAKIVIRSDQDGNMKIDEWELPHLTLRLQIELQPYGIRLDTNKLQEMIREDNDISQILKFCAEVLFQEMPTHDNDGGSVDSDLTSDFEAFCRHMSQEEEEADNNGLLGRKPRMSFADKAGMITVDERLSGGSVEVARGNRMTIMVGKGAATDSRRKTVMKEVKKRQTRMSASLARAGSGSEWKESSRVLPGMVVVGTESAEF